MPSPIEVIVNAAGGSFVEGKTDEEIKTAFEAAKTDFNLNLVQNPKEIEKITESKSQTADIIVGGGGDGTLNSIAKQVLNAGKTFGVLPLGTLNHFSKDLGIPQELGPAVEIISNGNTQKIDIAEVNGQIFLNNSSIGLYPRIVHKRQRQQERLGRGKWSAAFLAALNVFRRDSLFRVSFELDGRTFTRKTPFVFIGNNEYLMDFYNIGTRANITDGKLCVYFLRRGGRSGVVMLLLKTIFGVLRQSKEFEEIMASEITINMRKKRVLVAYDGEIAVMETPLKYRILPGALEVLVPASDENKE